MNPTGYNSYSGIPGVGTNISPYVDQLRNDNTFNNVTLIHEPTSKSYYKWVANKKNGLISRWSGKMMVPICQRPFIGIILILVMFVIVYFIVKYIYNFRCSIRQLNDNERKSLTDQMVKSEINKLNSILSEMNNKSGFTANNISEDMIHEQAMFYKFSEAEQRVYTKVSEDDRKLIFTNYLKSLK
jgi:hypothetical protein